MRGQVGYYAALALSLLVSLAISLASVSLGFFFPETVGQSIVLEDPEPFYRQASLLGYDLAYRFSFFRPIEPGPVAIELSLSEGSSVPPGSYFIVAYGGVAVECGIPCRIEATAPGPFIYLVAYLVVPGNSSEPPRLDMVRVEVSSE
ncbi:MAG: hypothetical protein F7C07_07630 [Desulfurococcales archaeon]|nr:hypothetical protein [Desulfurococcales archaeon]